MSENPEIFVVIVIGIVLGLLLVGFIVATLFLYQRRQQRQEQEIITMKDKYEKEALRSQLEIQENTFKNIAQELHDNIGQMLSVVKLSLSVLPIEKDHKAVEQVKNSQEVLNKAIIDLSNLTKSLHTERIADIGLIESIRFELYAIRKAGIVQVQFHPEGNETPLSEQKAVFLFRMFQEILNNILKHAKASEVIVHVKFLDDIFVLEIKDNGIGFSVEEKKQSTSSGSGVGLRSLFNRAQIIGAELTMNSEPGKGTNVLIRLPLQEA
ncbi:MAG TPA: sensor histidine kinase [Chitinophagaceae bacterium]|jgi:signal transduction histidine kinase|nr:sensor histidine kinase [Chitinophagaceae bacterium]